MTGNRGAAAGAAGAAAGNPTSPPAAAAAAADCCNNLVDTRAGELFDRKEVIEKDGIYCQWENGSKGMVVKSAGLQLLIASQKTKHYVLFAGKQYQKVLLAKVTIDEVFNRS
ncbi:protein of unknown function [Taphrina deformans PYCC 5710]|uniref:Uncharacterized protein n=1 Tax=Taphrina deformans (strain PYCC 5710 / ATCC 11124 / CBS 356.35 / IMI 108563 / JCM 9778 / NBRC 8474) TaxID=1097556 RepID=R4XGG0_TAPDE|nr:protein of unknown function [Taphrina deformans PYCC 5710]|eukprot:CCG84852.1 protein of unknown function [Taphrina deformans PYCC 5710]